MCDLLRQSKIQHESQTSMMLSYFRSLLEMCKSLGLSLKSITIRGEESVLFWFYPCIRKHFHSSCDCMWSHHYCLACSVVMFGKDSPNEWMQVRLLNVPKLWQRAFKWRMKVIEVSNIHESPIGSYKCDIIKVGFSPRAESDGHLGQSLQRWWLAPCLTTEVMLVSEARMWNIYSVQKDCVLSLSFSRLHLVPLILFEVLPNDVCMSDSRNQDPSLGLGEMLQKASNLWLWLFKSGALSWSHHIII